MCCSAFMRDPRITMNALRKTRSACVARGLSERPPCGQGAAGWGGEGRRDSGACLTRPQCLHKRVATRWHWRGRPETRTRWGVSTLQVTQDQLTSSTPARGHQASASPSPPLFLCLLETAFEGRLGFSLDRPTETDWMGSARQIKLSL